MKKRQSRIQWKYIILTVLIVAFIPFPTEMIPELNLRAVDENNQPLGNIMTEQSWTNYSFIGGDGFDEKCTDANGNAVFPRRFLWASAISRVISPILAEIGTLAHGSTGVSSYVRVFDRNYISDYYYWKDKKNQRRGEEADELPSLIKAKQSDVVNAKSCKQ